MAAFGQQNIRWVPPLPTGWEAKYDPTQKRYFFIDHATKKTSWDDPRFGRAAPPPPQHQAPVHHQGEAIPMQMLYDPHQHGHHQQAAQPSHPQPSPRRQPQQQQQQHPQHPQHPQHYQQQAFEDTSFVEDLPPFEVDESALKRLQKEFPTCDLHRIRQGLERNLNAYRATELELELLGYKKQSEMKQPSLSRYAQDRAGGRDAIIHKLKAEFPTTELSLIQDIVVGCEDDEQKARAELVSLDLEQATGNSGSAATSPKRLSSPQRSTSSSRPASPPPMSAAEKEQITREMQEKFPATTRNTIEMVLESCGYKKSIAEPILRPMSSGETSAARPQKKQTPAAQSSSRPTTPAKAAMTSAQKDRLAATLAGEFPKLDQSIIRLALETAGHSVKKARDMLKFMYADNSAASPKTTSPKPGSAMGSHTSLSVTGTGSDAGYDEVASLDYFLYDNYARPSSASGTSPGPRTPTKTVAPKARGKGQTTKAKKRRTDAVVTAQHQVYQSENRTPAKGADPALQDGPDITRVERYYSPTLGPNKQICHGPNPSLIGGRTRANGPDPSLRQGPRSAHCSGPMSDHWKGSQRVLVSEV